MAQWDVYVNPNERARERVPYIVDLQSALLDALPTRFVAPLVKTRSESEALPRRMIPAFTVRGVALTMRPHLSGPIDARLLQSPVLSLRDRAREITDALDAVVSGI